MLDKNEADRFAAAPEPERPADGFAPEEEPYTLEDILREFGSNAAPEEGIAVPDGEFAASEEEPLVSEEEITVSEEEITISEEEEEEEEPAVSEAEEREDAPVAEPHPSGEEFSFDPAIFSETVQAAQEEQRAKNALSFRERLVQNAHIRRNRKQQAQDEKRRREASAAAARAAALEAEDRKEAPFGESFSAERKRYAAMRRLFRLSLLPSLGALVLVLLTAFSLLTVSFCTALSLGLVFLSLLIGVPVVQDALRKLADGAFGTDLFILLTAAVDMADGFLSLFGVGTAHEPVTALACFGISAALGAKMLDARSRRDSLNLLARDRVAYDSVRLRDGLIVRQAGPTAGFTRLLYTADVTEHWNAVLLPIITVAIPVFALLASLAHGKWADFSFFLSVLFTAASLLFLPLFSVMPCARVSRRLLLHSGVALAGLSGARLLTGSRRVAVTDSDLFPAGSIQLNGIKLLFGESIGRALTCAASLTEKSGSGLADVFCRALKKEGGILHPVEQFSFSAYGGMSGVIRGETVSLGVAGYLRHLREIKHLDAKSDFSEGGNTENMLFLVIDRTLVAVFALKYTVSDSSDWAIDAMRRFHLTPILAARDPALTPRRFGRSFGKRCRPVFPPLKERLALSGRGRGGGETGAFLFRDGLRPYAESLVASRRLLLITRLLGILSLGGSIVSVLLFFYLLFSAGIAAVSPLRLVLHQFLFALAGFILAGRADRYRY